MATGASSNEDSGSDPDHLDRIHKLLRFVAGGGQPSRETAVDYLNHRSQLLSSPIREVLPGFLYQCGTVDRFKDFIYLYDPDPQLRSDFVDRMIAKARAFRDPPLVPAPPPAAPVGKTRLWEF